MLFTVKTTSGIVTEKPKISYVEGMVFVYNSTVVKQTVLPYAMHVH
jgi:hypothetical protein